jgi:hypothetical protein
MSRVALGFFTHMDLDRLCGGGSAGARARQRQMKDGLLPRARWEQVGRARVGFVAEPALARLVVGQAGFGPEERVLRRVVDVHGEIVHDELFDALVAAAVDWLGDRAGAWNLSGLSSAVAELAPDELERWHGRLDEYAATLAESGLHVDSHLGRVADATDDVLTLALGGGRRARYSMRHTATVALELGAEIAVDRVELLGRSSDFLVPVLQRKRTTPGAVEPPSRNEQFAMSPFADTITAVLTGRIPRNRPPRFVGDADEALKARTTGEYVTAEALAPFAEEPRQPEVHRSGFRPAAARP